MSENSALSAATDSRKARLAQLKSLKRKQAPTQEDGQLNDIQEHNSNESDKDSLDVTHRYVSGRNYDRETKGPRLGFETAPSEGQDTLESQAKVLSSATKRQAEEEEKEDKPVDLFKLQPKKPNWDLKRDLERKLEPFNVKTDNAIARLVRERIQSNQKREKQETSHRNDEEAIGMEGNVFVEAIHLREKEEAQEDWENDDEEEVVTP